MKKEVQVTFFGGTTINLYQKAQSCTSIFVQKLLKYFRFLLEKEKI